MSEIEISLTSSINQTVAQCQTILKEEGRISLVGMGNSLSKCITIAEILKRQDTCLVQETALTQHILPPKQDEEWKESTTKKAAFQKFLPKLNILLERR